MKESSMRFIKEYANFKKASLKDLRDLNPERVDKAISQVDLIVRMARRGLITADECMMNIAHVDNHYMMEVWKTENK